MRNAHFEVVHHVDEMKHRLPVRAHDDEIRVRLLAVGQLASHIADDQVRNEDGGTVHLELDRSVRFIRQPFREQGLDPPLVNVPAAALKVRTVVAAAGPGGIAAQRAFVPVQPQPAQAVEDNLDSRLGVACRIGVFDAQDESPARMPGIKPIKQRRASPAYMQEPRRTRRKANAWFHRPSLAQKSSRRNSRPNSAGCNIKAAGRKRREAEPPPVPMTERAWPGGGHPARRVAGSRLRQPAAGWLSGWREAPPRRGPAAACKP